MMMRRTVPVVTFCIFALMLSVSMAYAYGAKVWTTDASGNPKTRFDEGETIHIHWEAEGTVNIRISYQDHSPAGEWTDQPQSGEIDYVPTKGEGCYFITLNEHSMVTFVIGYFFVVPELPFGAVLASVACFGALGLARFRQIKHKFKT